MLIWRFFVRQRVVHLAVVALLASAIVVLSMYGAYLTRQAQLLSARLEPRVGDGYVLVSEVNLRNAATLPPFRGGKEPPVLLINSWVKTNLPTGLGDMMVIMANQSELPGVTLQNTEVAVPISFASTYGLEIGSVIGVKLSRLMDFTVTHFHDGKLFGDCMVMTGGTGQQATHFLYQTRTEEPLSEVIRYLRRVYPVARLEDVTTVSSVASDITRASYSPGMRAKVELITFITIAYLSTSLLSFLDRRKVLAILKSMGLTSGELMRVIAGENSLAPLTAAILGAGLSWGVLWWFSRLGLLGAPSINVVTGAVLGVVPAVAIGILVPARLAQQATVNQLLYERPIPFVYGQVKGLNRRYPALEPKMAEGIRFIKLDVVDGEFPGFVFRKLGDSVKAGEVLAVMHDWGGLRVREFLAPVSGQIVHYHLEGGFIGIKPLNMEQGGPREGSSHLH